MTELVGFTITHLNNRSLMSTGVMLNTLVCNSPIFKGFQWALYNATHCSGTEHKRAESVLKFRVQRIIALEQDWRIDARVPDQRADTKGQQDDQHQGHETRTRVGDDQVGEGTKEAHVFLAGRILDESVGQSGDGGLIEHAARERQPSVHVRRVA